jgi:hypothetical protein
MNRRGWLAGLLTLAAAPALAADPAPAAKTVEVGKVFPYLDRYLRLPAAERDRFVMAYYLTRDGKPAAGAQGWIDDGGRRVRIPFGANGRAERLPTLEQLQAKRRLGFDGAAGAKFGMSLSLEPAAQPAAELSATELAASVAQATRALKKAAGLMRMAVPTFDAVAFPGGQGGEVVFADGRAAALPIEKGVPVFKPAAHPGARTIRFRTPPRQLRLA